MKDNARAAALMTLSMALFALEDAFIKHLAGRMPVYQLLALADLLGLGFFWLVLIRRRQAVFSPALLHPMVITRNLGEAVGSFGFVIALAAGDLSTTAAILQVLPLAIVVGAVLFLGEKVGWRRWTSILVGFAGVLLIIRPGTDAFQPAMLWAVLGVFGLAVRDLATRRIAADIPSDLLSASAFGAVAIAAVLLGLVSGQPMVLPSLWDWVLVAGMMLFTVTGYTTLVTATRLGEASAVAPFRYTRLAFAMIVAVVVFSERPDLPTLTGAALIALAGGYAMWRDALRRDRDPEPVSGPLRPGES